MEPRRLRRRGGERQKEKKVEKKYGRQSRLSVSGSGSQPAKMRVSRGKVYKRNRGLESEGEEVCVVACKREVRESFSSLLFSSLSPSSIEVDTPFFKIFLRAVPEVGQLGPTVDERDRTRRAPKILHHTSYTHACQFLWALSLSLSHFFSFSSFKSSSPTRRPKHRHPIRSRRRHPSSQKTYSFFFIVITLNPSIITIHPVQFSSADSGSWG